MNLRRHRTGQKVTFVCCPARCRHRNQTIRYLLVYIHYNICMEEFTSYTWPPLKSNHNITRTEYIFYIIRFLRKDYVFGVFSRAIIKLHLDNEYIISRSDVCIVYGRSRAMRQAIYAYVYIPYNTLSA